jgi:hypothetical protein
VANAAEARVVEVMAAVVRQADLVAVSRQIAEHGAILDE